MIKELVHDPILLALKSEPATAADLQTAQDLLETLTAHKEICVGMAANMIGVNKSIICFDNDGKYIDSSLQYACKAENNQVFSMVAYNGTSYGIIWEDDRTGDEIRFRKLN